MKIQFAASIALVLGLAGCNEPSRMGMVKDPVTGLQYGSVVERPVMIDAVQFKNRKVKVTTRNTSGDLAFDMGEFADRLRAAYASKGFQPTEGDDFGIRVDLNVLRSSQYQKTFASEYAFLGATGGGVAGYQTNARAAGAAAGVAAGAALGTIIGSYDTRDTYIIIAEVNIAMVDQRTGVTERSITFQQSPRLVERETDFRPYRALVRTHVGVFAGGRNPSRDEITSQVRERLARIVADII